MPCAARTGERPGEIFRTALSDYQPDEGRVVIRVVKDREPRFVPIYGDVIAVINAWLKVRPKDCPSDYLFVSDCGLQMSVNTWAKEFKKYAVAAGIRDPHKDCKTNTEFYTPNGDAPAGSCQWN